MADNLNTRAIVYDMLMSIEKENTPSHILLSQTLMKYQYLDKRDRAFISRLFRGTLEYEIFLDGVIRQFSSVRLNKIKPPIKIILRMSVNEIFARNGYIFSDPIWNAYYSAQNWYIPLSGHNITFDSMNDNELTNLEMLLSLEEHLSNNSTKGDGKDE